MHRLGVSGVTVMALMGACSQRASNVPDASVGSNAPDAAVAIDAGVSSIENAALFIWDDVGVEEPWNILDTPTFVEVKVLPTGCTGPVGRDKGAGICSPCPRLEGLGATYAGVPMQGPTSTTPGLSCDPPAFNIDLRTITAPANGVIEVHDKTTSLRATLSVDLLTPRHATTTAGWTMCGGKPLQAAWTPATDITSSGASGTAWWKEKWPMMCGEGCAGASFDTSVSAIAAGEVELTAPPNVTLSFNGSGLLQLRMPGAAAAGSAASCEGASSCTYDFLHPVLVPASYSPTCP